MGIIFLALVANGSLQSGDDVPTWVVVSAASAIAAGTYVGGWRIIKTMGSRIIKMDPAQGFAAQSVGAAVILSASHVGFPLSTTHVISGAIMGAGAAKRVSAVRWGVAGNIVVAWVLTLPGRRDRRRAHLCGHAHLRRRRGRAAGGQRRAGRGARGGAGAPGGHRPDADGGGLARVPFAAVEVGQLFEVAWVSLVAGVVVSTAFSLVVLFSARSVDARRGGRSGPAAAYGGLALFAFAAFMAVVIFGVQIMLSKG